MMMLLAQTPPSNSIPGASGAGEIMTQGLQASQLAAEQFNSLWETVITNTGGLYAAIADVGVFFAVGTLLLFMTLWIRDLLEGESLKPLSELIWPLIVIALLANHGALLAQSTKELRGYINNVNQQLLSTASAGINLQDAYQQAQGQIAIESIIRTRLDNCNKLPAPDDRQRCLNEAQAEAQRLTAGLPNQGGSRLQTVLNLFQNPAEAAGALVGSVVQTAIRGWLIALSVAFQWGVEISLLLTGLLGPVAVGGTLLPTAGTKPLFAWLTGFFSVGFCKLCFNIMVGLVSTIILNSPNSDPMIFAFFVGILSPLLALVLAAGGGMAVFSSLSKVAAFGAGGTLYAGTGLVRRIAARGR